MPAGGQVAAAARCAPGHGGGEVGQAVGGEGGGDGEVGRMNKEERRKGKEREEEYVGPPLAQTASPLGKGRGEEEVGRLHPPAQDPEPACWAVARFLELTRADPQSRGPEPARSLEPPCRACWAE